MSKKSRKRTPRTVGTARRRRSPRRRRRSSRGVDPLVWVGGVVAIIVALLVLNLWQSGALPTPSEPSRSEDPANLSPLAEAGRPIQGGHDMSIIPQQTPAPRAAPSDTPVPQLSLASISHDFGRIRKQPDVAHIFTVQNTGTADLMIDNLVTSCGCTIAALSSNVIPPGQRADLTVTFDPDFHETQGPVMRLVWFATNDPTQPWAELRLAADVQ